MELSDESSVRVKREKGKEPGEEWTLIGGDGRCAACLRDDTRCLINLAAVEKWRDEVKEGKRFHRNPSGTNCKRCTLKKKKCELPATEKLRRALVAGSPAKPRGRSQASGQAPSVSSGGRRRQVLEGVMMPPRKRQRVEEEETEADSALVEVLRGMDRSLKGVGSTLDDMSRVLSLMYSSSLRQDDSLRRIAEVLARQEGPPESVATPGVEASGSGVSGVSSDLAGDVFGEGEGEGDEAEEEGEVRMG